jgi:hypothetical protein
MLYHAIISPKLPDTGNVRVSLETETIGDAWERLIAAYGAKNVQHVWADYEESKRNQFDTLK